MTAEGDGFWEAAKEIDGLIIGDDGSIRFTSEKRKDLAEYFAMAGIDIRTIKTKEDYLAARQAASPYFEEWLVKKASSGKPSTERSLLVATLVGDDREARRLKMKLDSQRIAKKSPSRGG